MYIFVVDTSPPAISSGFTALVLAAAVNAVEQTLAQCQANPDEGLQRSGYGATPIFAGGKRAKVGLVSFDNVVTFYRSSGGEFGNVVMSDIEDPFAALPPSEWLVALDDAPRAVVGKVERLRIIFSNTSSRRIHGCNRQRQYHACVVCALPSRAWQAHSTIPEAGCYISRTVPRSSGKAASGHGRQQMTTERIVK